MKRHGFTLAELLISLAILGVIATFTIPKILNAQQNSSYNAKAHETAAMISAAFQNYKLANGITSSTGSKDLTPYMNYIATDTTSTIDDAYGSPGRSCSIYSGVCLKLHNGGLLQYFPADIFNGTSTLNAVPFVFDPNGQESDGTTNGPGKGLVFFIYADGKIKDEGTIEAHTTYYSTIVEDWSPDASHVPPWFSW